MNRLKRWHVVPVLVVLALVITFLVTRSSESPATSPPNVTTAAFNNLRTGWDPNEPNLSPSQIQSGTFGKIFSKSLTGSIYAQPLVYNGTLVVTTEDAYAYGLNANVGKDPLATHVRKALLGERDWLRRPDAGHRIDFDAGYRPDDRGRVPDDEAPVGRLGSRRQPLVAGSSVCHDRSRTIGVSCRDTGNT